MKKVKSVQQQKKRNITLVLLLGLSILLITVVILLNEKSIHLGFIIFSMYIGIGLWSMFQINKEIDSKKQKKYKEQK